MKGGAQNGGLPADGTAMHAASGSGDPSGTSADGGSGRPTGSAGSSNGAAGMAAMAGGLKGSGVDAGGSLQVQPSTPIKNDCQGFPLDGLKYSPGGNVLPNKCMPFDATTNNPYAVRCIDAMPSFKTQFPGDQFCILPPPPEQGIQIGLHPQGDVDTYWKQIWAGDLSGYDNPPKEWVLMPGDEVTQNYRSHATNTEMMSYYRTYFRMRTGSHHNIITMHMSTDPDGWIAGVGEALPGLFDASAGAVVGVLGGQQRPDDSTPVTFEKPPEDEGMYLQFPPTPSIIFNMHHFNVTTGPVLREGWSNIWWESDKQTLVSWFMGLELTQTFTLNVDPGTTADLHYSFAVTAPHRLVRAFGHRHAWTPTFTSWIERAGGKTEVAYQSFDWFDMPTYRYDSVVQNPPPAPDAKTDGAMSGVVTLEAGDKLHFNCHVEYTDARQAKNNSPNSPEKIGALRFANEVYTGEMCIQFGNATGGSLGSPAIDSSPVPDFAKITR
jgi:hypothetical protein